MRTNYNEFKGFEYIFLEDSFILKIIEKQNEIKFTMELVLTTLHPMYSKPKPNEMYCYKDAEISFSDIKRLEWTEKNLIPSIDASDEIDYGNINELYLEKEVYYIWSDIGRLKIISSEPQINYI